MNKHRGQDMDTKLAADLSGGNQLHRGKSKLAAALYTGTASKNLLLCNIAVSKIMPLYYTAKSQTYFGA
jgi:hypothetical protein